jgi:hypothetical protein
MQPSPPAPSPPQEADAATRRDVEERLLAALDLILGLVATGVSATRSGVQALRPVANLFLRPPLVPQKLQPDSWLDAMVRRGRTVRSELTPLVDRSMPVVAEAVMDRIDVNQLVAKVDMNAIIARLDMNAIIARVDLGSVSRQVIDEVDLPEIIRESSGAITSESVLGMRMQSIEADERLNRVIDKILLRRNGRNTQPRWTGRGSGDGAE